jgi:hypothetical protein
VAAAHAQGSGGDASGTFLLLLVLALACYFLPTLIALSRGKANGTGGVFFVNLALGWTVVGWFVSFIWACSGQTKGQIRLEEQRHRELMAALKTKDSA